MNMKKKCWPCTNRANMVKHVDGCIPWRQVESWLVQHPWFFFSRIYIVKMICSLSIVDQKHKKSSSLVTWGYRYIDLVLSPYTSNNSESSAPQMKNALEEPPNASREYRLSEVNFPYSKSVAQTDKNKLKKHVYDASQAHFRSRNLRPGNRDLNHWNAKMLA